MPHFALQVLANRQCREGIAVAVASLAETHPRIVDSSAAARREGVVPGMLVTRAMGMCGALEVVEADEARVREAGEAFVRRVESIGAAVQPLAPGVAVFDIAPIERLYGGREAVLARLRGVFAAEADIRIGLGPTIFVARMAARMARDGRVLVVEPHEAAEAVAGLPLGALPLDEHSRELLGALGIETVGAVRAIGREHLAARFGAQGELVWRLAGGDDPERVTPRVPVEAVVETIEFPDPVGNIMTLQRATGMLVERALSRPVFQGHAPGTFTVVARLATGGSWHHRRSLREPTVDVERVTLCATAGLDEVPAPVTELELRCEQFVPRETMQPELAPDKVNAEHRQRERAVQVVRHVQAAVGDDAVMQVLEIEPWSRIPERHAVLVPRQVGDTPSGGSAA